MSKVIISNLCPCCHDCGQPLDAILQPRFEGVYITLLTCWNPECLLNAVTLSVEQYAALTEGQFEAYRKMNRISRAKYLRVSNG